MSTQPPPQPSQAFQSLTSEQLTTALAQAYASGDTNRADIILNEVRGRMVADQATIAALQNMQNVTAKSLANTTTQLSNTAQALGKQSASHRHATLTMDAVKMEKPPSYDGTPSKLNNFKFRVTQYCKVVGLNDVVKQQQLASSLLVGRALTWWRAQCDIATKGLYPVDLLTTMSINEFFKALAQAFHDVDHENRLRQRFNSLQQTGSVQAYIAVFRGVIVDLGDDAPQPADQLWQFVKGLKQQVQLNVRLQRPKSLDEAMELAETTDSAIADTTGRGKQRDVSFGNKGNKGKNKQRAQYPSQYHGPMPMDIDFLSQKQAQAGVKGKKQHGNQRNSDFKAQVTTGKPKSDITCYRCGKRGHMARECRVRLNVAQQEVGQSSSGGDSVAELASMVRSLAVSFEHLQEQVGNLSKNE